MNVTIIGTGYVGLVTGTCLAHIGHKVVCVDNNSSKIEKLKKGIPHIFEDKLESMIKENILKRRLVFTCNIEEGVKASEIIMIAVGTPSQNNGDVDLRQVDSAAEEIGKYINGYKIVVNKSTVPVGSTDRVKEILMKNMKDRKVDFDVVSNPEFLREGTAVYDTMCGDRIIIGSNSEKAINIMKELYKPLNIQCFVTKPESAELIKYASNTFLAVKISYINEIANICEKIGVDVSEVAEGMGMDRRIGSKFLKAGIGFGGACFPKDVNGLIKIAESNNCEMRLGKSALEINEEQRLKPVTILKKIYGNLNNLRVGILGLAFKAGTDDVREAPSLYIIKELSRLGVKICAYDPIAMPGFGYYTNEPVALYSSIYETVKDCDAVLVLTEWESFKEMNLRRVKRLMRGDILIDGRNIFKVERMRAVGFRYYSVGNGETSFESSRKDDFKKIKSECKKIPLVSPVI